MHGGTGIVLVAPHPVPNTRDSSRGNKHHRGVVNSGGQDRNGRGHAEEREGEARPGYKDTMLAKKIMETKATSGLRLTNGNNVGGISKLAQGKLGVLDLPAAIHQANGNGAGV